MKCKRQFFIALFDVLSSQLMTIGDILFVIFVVQLITRFEVAESYPFIGIRGYMLILLIYLTSLACLLQSTRLRKK
ncbi:hypothetical protein ALT761_02259 [Alteromonas sp. 76-1]|jgi:hypothetical protein|nr:hypothetical protein ALT761_02259 [Alteromonas sp. 76-1]